MIIGIGGRAGAGKSISAEYISYKFTDITKSDIDSPITHLINCKIIPFAQPIKDIAKIFGFTNKQIYDQSEKCVIDDFWGMTSRTFQQMVGTDLFREHFREDVWVRIMEKKILTYDDYLIVIPDVRFPNELDMIKKYNGKTVYIDRDTHNGAILNDKELSHQSENVLTGSDFDIIIDNNEWTTDYINLYKQLDNII